MNNLKIFNKNCEKKFKLFNDCLKIKNINNKICDKLRVKWELCYILSNIKI